MPAPLTVEMISQRLQNFPHDSYLYVWNFMKSVVLAGATLVLLEILFDLKNNWPRLLPWLAALAGTLVTYTTSGRGILLTNSRANLWDDILPLLLGIVEFCLFAILAPREKYPYVWRWWLVVVGIHALLGACLVHNRINLTRLTEDFVADLQPLASDYLGWCRASRNQAVIGAILAFALAAMALALLPRWLTGACYALVYWIFVLPFIGIFAYLIWLGEKHRKHIDRAVFGAQP